MSTTEGATREQSFVARYNFDPPFLTTRRVRMHVVEGEERHYIGLAEHAWSLRVAQLLEVAGHKVEREEKESREYDLPDDFRERAREAAVAARNAYAKPAQGEQYEAGDDAGDVVLSLYDGLVTVRTPTRLGQGLHKERRRAIEAWLRAEGVKWTLTCATEHSDAACRPILTGSVTA